MFDIDWQGTKQLTKFKNLKLLKIFLITDSKEELKKRLLKRDQNTKEEVEKRYNLLMKTLNTGMIMIIFINKNLESCFKQIDKFYKIIEKNIQFFSKSSVIL